ncbi:L,D-transpeptidase family protein [Actinoplanes rectilineatus]|uniref:L,D-transpeptidase family protein n=1 Tax=Actinoplanes rectilineatus TaxID=113571 RepID=UPI001FE014EA|nr:L,D-transpeptidase family protein [Actinoplanes rectilineatus]
MRRSAAVVAMVLAGLMVPSSPAEAALPDGLTHLGKSKQVIVVSGKSWTSTHATVRAYQRGSDGKWRLAFPAMAARIGYGGWVWASKRVQDTGKTPAGTFTITEAFGVRADPGTALPYRKVDGNDYWVGDNKDAKTYNLFQPSASAKRTWRKSQAERLAAYPKQYAHVAVIDFNRASGVTWNAERGQYVASTKANTKRGSAIFLHASGKGSTAGCVSVSRANMVRLLTWLKPARKPRIVMAPASALEKA